MENKFYNKTRLFDELNCIIQNNLISSEGLRRASNKVWSEKLRDILFHSAMQRDAIANELKAEMTILGENPDTFVDTNTFKISPWMDIESVHLCVYQQDVLDMCEEGEINAKKYYEKLLEKPLPKIIQYVLEIQRNTVVDTLTMLRIMERQKAA